MIGLAPANQPSKKPGSNLTGTRSNNTLIHNRSKYAPPNFLNGPAPLLPPAVTYGYSAQLAGLQTQFAGALALKKAMIAQARSDATLARQQARSEAVAGMAGAVNTALDRGLLGSSIDAGNRAAVLARLGEARQGIVADRAAQVAQARLQGLQALGQFYLGAGQLAAQQGLEQAQLAIQQYQADQLGLMTQSFTDLQKKILQKLRGRQRDLQLAAAAGAVPGNLGAAATTGALVGSLGTNASNVYSYVGGPKSGKKP